MEDVNKNKKKTVNNGREIRGAASGSWLNVEVSKKRHRIDTENLRYQTRTSDNGVSYFLIIFAAEVTITTDCSTTQVEDSESNLANEQSTGHHTVPTSIM